MGFNAVFVIVRNYVNNIGLFSLKKNKINSFDHLNRNNYDTILLILKDDCSVYII